MLYTLFGVKSEFIYLFYKQYEEKGEMCNDIKRLLLKFNDY